MTSVIHVSILPKARQLLDLVVIERVSTSS